MLSVCPYPRPCHTIHFATLGRAKRARAKIPNWIRLFRGYRAPQTRISRAPPPTTTVVLFCVLCRLRCDCINKAAKICGNLMLLNVDNCGFCRRRPPSAEHRSKHCPTKECVYTRRKGATQSRRVLWFCVALFATQASIPRSHLWPHRAYSVPTALPCECVCIGRGGVAGGAMRSMVVVVLLLPCFVRLLHTPFDANSCRCLILYTKCSRRRWRYLYAICVVVGAVLSMRRVCGTSTGTATDGRRVRDPFVRLRLCYLCAVFHRHLYGV